MGRERGSGVWQPRLVAALQELGGEAKLTDIYAQIERAHQGSLLGFWKSTVRQTLQTHDPDSRYFQFQDALFYHKGRGTWGLRTSAAKAALAKPRQVTSIVLCQQEKGTEAL